MPTSNSKPQPNAATDSPLGAPKGNEPYTTVRAKNWANPDAPEKGQDLTDTKPIGNIAGGSATKPEPKPAQGA